MIQRYSHPDIQHIFGDKHKLDLWQETELAVIQATTMLDLTPEKANKEIRAILLNQPIDLDWWKRQDTRIHHDLNAFIDERTRFLPANLHQYFHKNLTSYDTEEPAFARMLLAALEVLRPLGDTLEVILVRLALKYRYTLMLARTHGQWAELQSFGMRVLSWLAEYRIARQALSDASQNLKYSKLSGAIGKYNGLSPIVEKEALNILGLIPFYGATQIMPRILYAPIAQAISNLVAVIDNIGNDIRLSARSGRPLLQEPFSKTQKGSSAMPHKKNTIRTEQLEGMARLAKGYAGMIADNIRTWEERSIEQSSVERVAWPDLFHVAAQTLKVIMEVLIGLRVYQDNMLGEIHGSRGTYASAAAKEFLKTRLADSGLEYEDIYRLVQLACFNVFQPDAESLAVRDRIPKSFAEADENLWLVGQDVRASSISLAELIPLANLRPSDSLDISQEQIDTYNQALKRLFADGDSTVKEEWEKLFQPAFLMQHEVLLYEKVLRI
jgi:adenylosuccinate lyase